MLQGASAPASHFHYQMFLVVLDIPDRQDLVCTLCSVGKMLIGDVYQMEKQSQTCQMVTRIGQMIVNATTDQKGGPPIVHPEWKSALSQNHYCMGQKQLSGGFSLFDR
jgi:hypothetical protein